ncbi:discoidin domain-containing protein [Lysobacter sp. CA196]|uniref:discoidin domain-containing protein n=1 Tax=Lysobacter sp. CA196 TaxID=3455606 RepID=UPI003F8D52C8
MNRRSIAWLLFAAFSPLAPAAADEPTRANLALHRPATGSPICKPGEEAEKAVNGLLASKTHDKFCSLQRPAWLRIDLQSERELRGFTIKHAQAGDESAAMNTRAFALSVSDDGATWRQVAKVDENVAGISVHRIAPTRARYVRLDIEQPAQDPADPATRIYELEAW